MTKPVDFFIDRSFFLDIGSTLHDIRLRLVVVIVRDEIMNSIFGKKLLEFLSELSREGFIMRHDEGGTLEFRDDIRHGEGLSRARHSEKRLEIIARTDGCDEFLDRGSLVTSGGVGGIEGEHTLDK